MNELKEKLLERRLIWKTGKHARKLFRRKGLQAPPFRLRFSRSSNFPYDMTIRRDGPLFMLDYTPRNPFYHAYEIIQGRAGDALYIMANCPAEITELSFNMADGNQESAALLHFSSRNRDAVLVPDPWFLSTRAFEKFRRHAEANTVPWGSRRATLRWRGKDNGAGCELFRPKHHYNPIVNARIRMTLIAASLPDTDCRFSAVKNPDLRPLFEEFGVMGAPIPETDWINDKYAVDIDGYSNTWSNMFVRMLFGCCVLKVESQEGFRQWYYDRLEPWVHYVPVAADMRDLGEKLDWARRHDQEAEEIARNGQRLARSMTLESETRHAVDTITATER